MQPEVETLAGLERRIKVTVQTADIEKQVEQELRRAARTAKVAGFRPGKVPLSMLRQSHEPGIRHDVINDKLSEAIGEALEKTGVRIAGTPSVEPDVDTTDEEKLTFSVTFEVYPEVELPEFGDLEVERATCEVTDESVNETVDVLRKQRTEYVEEEGRVAGDDDQVAVDFVGKLDGEPFEGGSAEDFRFLIGAGSMLAEFEDAVRGMKAGESKTFPLTFPEDYQAEHLAGKTVEFDVTVKAVQRPELPELNEDFARELGQAEGDVAKLLEEIRENIDREVEARTAGRTKDSVMKALLAAVNFDVPTALVDNEIEGRVAAARQELAQRGVPDADKMPIPSDLFKDEAERRVKLGLLLGAMIEKLELSPNQEQIKAKIEMFAQNYEDPAEVVNYYLSDAQRRAEVESVVLEDNVVDYVLEHAKVTPTEISFEEIMGMKAPEEDEAEVEEETVVETKEDDKKEDEA